MSNFDPMMDEPWPGLEDLRPIVRSDEPARLNPLVPRCGDGLHRIQTFDMCETCGEVWFRSEG